MFTCRSLRRLVFMIHLRKDSIAQLPTLVAPVHKSIEGVREPRLDWCPQMFHRR